MDSVLMGSASKDSVLPNEGTNPTQEAFLSVLRATSVFSV
jgi:hypothetical protein